MIRRLAWVLLIATGACGKSGDQGARQGDGAEAGADAGRTADGAREAAGGETLTSPSVQAESTDSASGGRVSGANTGGVAAESGAAGFPSSHSGGPGASGAPDGVDLTRVPAASEDTRFDAPWGKVGKDTNGLAPADGSNDLAGDHKPPGGSTPSATDGGRAGSAGGTNLEGGQAGSAGGTDLDGGRAGSAGGTNLRGGAGTGEGGAGYAGGAGAGGAGEPPMAPSGSAATSGEGSPASAGQGGSATGGQGGSATGGQGGTPASASGGAAAMGGESAAGQSGVAGAGGEAVGELAGGAGASGESAAGQGGTGAATNLGGSPAGGSGGSPIGGTGGSPIGGTGSTPIGGTGGSPIGGTGSTPIGGTGGTPTGGMGGTSTGSSGSGGTAGIAGEGGAGGAGMAGIAGDAAAGQGGAGAATGGSPTGGMGGTISGGQAGNGGAGGDTKGGRGGMVGIAGNGGGAGDTAAGGGGAEAGGAGGEAGSQAGAGGEAGSQAGAGGEAGSQAGAGGADAGQGGTALPGSLFFTTDPTLTGNDNGLAPQVGIVRFETNVPVTGTLSVSGGSEAWSVDLGALSTLHERTLLGLKPDTPYEVTLSVSDGWEQLVAAPLEWRTPPLPDDFPHLDFIGSQPSRMEPGMTLFNVRGPYYLIVVDNGGVVRWYCGTYRAENDHRLLANGHVIFPSRQREITEIDWRGDVVAAWHADDSPFSFTPQPGSVPVSAETFHHSIREMPNGNLLALSTETRTIDDFPTSTTDPDAETETARVTGDVIVEFTREGDVTKEIPLLDLLDPTRVGHNSIDQSWVSSRAKDWSHSNSVIYDPSSDAYIVSIRHQDAVIKVDRETESLVWILGTHSNWGEPWQDKLLDPVGEDFSWQYHQHAAELIPGGLGLFDNGNFRAAAYEPPQAEYSRAVSYAIDEERMTVSQLWSYGAESGPEFFYSKSMSDADWQRTSGNVLITAGRLQLIDDQGQEQDYSRILEVTADHTSVFELYVRAEAGDTTDYTTFNGKRIPDIRFAELGTP